MPAIPSRTPAFAPRPPTAPPPTQRKVRQYSMERALTLRYAQSGSDPAHHPPQNTHPELSEPRGPARDIITHSLRITIRRRLHTTRCRNHHRLPRLHPDLDTSSREVLIRSRRLYNPTLKRCHPPPPSFRKGPLHHQSTKPIIMDPPSRNRSSQANGQTPGFASPTRDHARDNPKFVDDCTRISFALQQSVPEAVRRTIRDNWEKCLLGSDFHQAFIVRTSSHFSRPSSFYACSILVSRHNLFFIPSSVQELCVALSVAWAADTVPSALLTRFFPRGPSCCFHLTSKSVSHHRTGFMAMDSCRVFLPRFPSGPIWYNIRELPMEYPLPHISITHSCFNPCLK